MLGSRNRTARLKERELKFAAVQQRQHRKLPADLERAQTDYRWLDQSLARQSRLKG
jgi:hypothetical protein